MPDRAVCPVPEPGRPGPGRLSPPWPLGTLLCDHTSAEGLEPTLLVKTDDPRSRDRSKPLKNLLCELIAISIYFPLSRIIKGIEKIGVNVSNLPLSFYYNG